MFVLNTFSGEKSTVTELKPLEWDISAMVNDLLGLTCVPGRTSLTQCNRFGSEFPIGSSALGRLVDLRQPCLAEDPSLAATAGVIVRRGAAGGSSSRRSPT